MKSLTVSLSISIVVHYVVISLIMGKPLFISSCGNYAFLNKHNVMNERVNNPNIDSEILQIIQEKGRACANAVVDFDYEGMNQCFHPKVLDMNGGKENMIQIMEKGRIEMKNQGYVFKSAEVGFPTLVKTINNSIYALVPTVIKIKVPGGVLINKGFLLAVSEGRSEKWYFVDTVKLNNTNINVIFPELKNNIDIPQTTEPIFVKD